MVLRLGDHPAGGESLKGRQGPARGVLTAGKPLKGFKQNSELI